MRSARHLPHLLAALGTAAAASLAQADPLAGREPPRGGTYATDWGTATLEIDQSALGRSNANATFRFQNGTVVWGYFLERQADRPGPYEFIGRYMRVPDPGGPPAALGATSPCSERLTNLPWRVALPSEQRYWGSLRILWSSSGNAFRGRVNACSSAYPAEVGATAQFSGKVAPIAEAVRQEFAQAPTLPRDGPCASIRAVAVAEIQPCQIRLGQPLRMRLVKDLPKGNSRVVFTPLEPDPGALTEAIGLNRPLPRNARLNTAQQAVREDRFWRAGDLAEVILPGATCGNPLWEVSLVDADGTTRTGLGVVQVTCDSGSEPARPRLLPRLPDKQ